MSKILRNDVIQPAAIDTKRRSLLKSAAGIATLGAAGGFPLIHMRNAWAEQAIGSFPEGVKGSTCTFGFCVPLTGPYSDEGQDELKAYRLAVRHLNEGGGMLNTFKPSALKGNGVLGKKVKYVTGDSETKPDAARAVARRMIERDKAIMFTGGSSSAVAVAQQYLAQDMGVIYMDALTHSNDTTGKDRRRYGFRYFFNAYMSGKALSPVIAKEYGKNRNAFHLTADYTWGHTQFQSMKEFTEKEGWRTVRNIMTPLGTPDFSSYLSAVLNSDADVLILNHYGKDMVNSLSQAVRFGLRKRQRNGKSMEIVVPLYSRLMAKGAGPDNVDGILGTSEWSWRLDDPGSRAFTKAFVDEYKSPPSQAAHVAYVQTLLYADAVERAGTFYPPEVIKALEDFEFEGTGNGKVLYRKDDHQAFHDLLVVRGKPKSKMSNEFDLLETVSHVSREAIMYPANLMPGELGPYIPVRKG